ncbi:MAG: tyrosine-type recombinase/integrase [Vicinamibacterales bacterium]
MSTTRKRHSRRGHIARAQSHHSFRGRLRWNGHAFVFTLPADLRPQDAARAAELVIAAIRTGQTLEDLHVTVRIGASDVAIPVKVRRDGVLLAKVAPPPPPVSALTIDQALTQYVAATALVPRAGRHRKGAGGTKASVRSDVARTNMMACWWIFTGEKPLAGFRFGSLPVAELRSDHIERILLDQASQGRPGSTQNKFRQLLTGFAKWVTAKGMVDRPLTLDAELVRRNTETRRTRRLNETERAALLAACKPWLRALVEGALETGCRLGELLGMTWEMADLDKRRITLPASLTKSSASRVIPISTRLHAILTMRRLGPDGEDLPPTAYVFGNEIGQQMKSIKTCWTTACRKAGVEGLHFHDLRREAASRLLEAGLPLHHVSKLLGHQNIATTSIYLSATDRDLERAFADVERREAEAMEREQREREERERAKAKKSPSNSHTSANTSRSMADMSMSRPVSSQ